ncbi:MAG: hypothetical protein ACK4RT_08375 [Erythrobacter sp.]
MNIVICLGNRLAMRSAKPLHGTGFGPVANAQTAFSRKRTLGDVMT